MRGNRKISRRRSYYCNRRLARRLYGVALAVGVESASLKRPACASFAAFHGCPFPWRLKTSRLSASAADVAFASLLQPRCPRTRASLRRGRALGVARRRTPLTRFVRGQVGTTRISLSLCSGLFNTSTSPIQSTSWWPGLSPAQGGIGAIAVKLSRIGGRTGPSSPRQKSRGAAQPRFGS